jgi:hypothetical protein
MVGLGDSTISTNTRDLAEPCRALQDLACVAILSPFQGLFKSFINNALRNYNQEFFAKVFNLLKNLKLFQALIFCLDSYMHKHNHVAP